MIKLSVIIVLYEEYKLVEKTLSSIYQNEIANMEVILVDNTPNNKGHKAVLKKFPKIKYFHNSVNSGFGGGVNFGLNKAKGEYILVLNPDMYILPQTIKRTIAYIEKHQTVGMVGPRLFTSPGKQERSANSSYPNLITILYYYNMPLYKLIRRFNKEYSPNLFSLTEHEGILEAKWISGQYTLVRRKALEELNGFDERFFLYFEDVDLCKRMIDSGWKVIYLPVGGIVQNGISKWKKTAITQAESFYMESLYKFYKKHYGRVYAFSAWLTGTTSSLISVPYLVFVVFIKKIFGVKSQSKILLPLWIDIARWHLTKGVKEVIKS
jgi:GT2 family glycosyltransferase